jgi:hypothetical protein
MKRIGLAIAPLVALAIVVLAGCSSSHGQSDTRVRPEMHLEQVVGPADLGYPGGRIDVQYELQVTNHSQEPITLRRVEVQSTGGGAYRLRHEAYPFKETVTAGNFVAVRFWAHAFQAGSFGRGSNEPVTLRAIVYFDSPTGTFQQFLLKELTQFESGR